MIKNPPVLENLENYEQWREDVVMWSEITDLEKRKQALAVHLTLKGQAREVANQVSTADKCKEDGLKTLLTKLDENFMQEAERRQFMAYQRFEKCIRKEGMPICDFMREFDTRYFKMKEKSMVLPDAVLAFRLIENCRLTEVQREQVMAATKPLSFKEVRATLKRMFEGGSAVEARSTADRGVIVKAEPVYVAKTTSREVSEDVRGDEEVMWTTHYGNRRVFGRNFGGRYNRFGRYNRSNWRQTGNGRDAGCFVCGSKDHWMRDCEQRWKENSNKDNKKGEEI